MNEQRPHYGLLWRLHRAFGPIAGGLILDFADLATFGPLGVLGPFVGTGVVLWISSLYRFSLKTKIILAFLAGIYCMVPLTEPFPIATLVCAACRFFEQPPAPPPPDSQELPKRKYVESKMD